MTDTLTLFPLHAHGAVAGPVQSPEPPAAEAGPALLTIHGLSLHQIVDRHILVSKTGDVETAVWLRKTLIAFDEIPGGLVDVTLPVGLARERGLA